MTCPSLRANKRAAGIWTRCYVIAGFFSFCAFKFNLIYKFFYRKQKLEEKLYRTNLLHYRDITFKGPGFYFPFGQIKHVHRLTLKESGLWKLYKVDAGFKEL